jgi:hypothetical protein
MPFESLDICCLRKYSEEISMRVYSPQLPDAFSSHSLPKIASATDGRAWPEV